MPQRSLITTYKTLLRPLLDYGDIIYDQPHNESVCEKLSSVQYKVALAIIGAIQGTSCEKIYQGLGLESLSARRWHKHLSCMFKIVKEAPNYFDETIRNSASISIFKCRLLPFIRLLKSNVYI